MSGRAGRRGLDERGIVILMVDEKISPSVGKEIVKVLFFSSFENCYYYYAVNIVGTLNFIYKNWQELITSCKA